MSGSGTGPVEGPEEIKGAVNGPLEGGPVGVAEAGHVNVKEIEVTAKQIVDRISSSNNRSRSSSSSTSRDIDGLGLTPTTTGPGPSSADSVSSAASLGLQGKKMSLPEISAEQKAVEQLLKAVEKWVHEARQDEDPETFEGSRDLDNLHWVFSIESYLRSLDTDWTSQKALTHKIATQMLNWLRALFHFEEKDKSEQFNAIHPHWDINSGLSAMTQLSLYLKFPDLIGEGYQHFQGEGKKTPVIYCSDDMMGQQICSKIGLPYNCINVVDFTDKSWVEQLEMKFKSDISSGKVPVALLMNTAVHHLEKGVKLAESHKVWVHFYGNNVLAYFHKRPESNCLGSSFTLDLTRWLKSPKLPYLTLYKRAEKIEPRVLELCELGAPRSEIMCFTPWFVAHVFGRPRLIALVNDAIYRGKFLLDLVQRFKSIAVVPNWSTLSDGSVILSTLTFQFNPSRYPNRRPSSASAPASPSSSSPSQPHSTQYLDTLNSWLFHIMDRDLRDTIPLEFVFVETRGWSIHVDIIRTRKLSSDDEAKILATVENHMHVLEATVNQKIKFQTLVESSDEMLWVNNENQWAGLGAVRYIPSNLRAKKSIPEHNGEGISEEQGEQAKETAPKTLQEEEKVKDEINHLNAQIVNKLRAIDSAFSLGDGGNGEWCVQFGMVTDETDVQELVRLVASTGEEIEESSEFFNKMSELVRKGIHEAEEELRKESEEALWEEGILRRVPIVGTFVSWFSPPAKETGVRGRAMNLTQGKVESTENIYKYHMQVKASTFNSNTSASTHSDGVSTKK